MNAVDRVIAVAEGELGYLEKKSNKDLDSKTGNAGSANYTKYNRDMKAWAGSAGLNDQWCQNFVDWVFVTAFGVDMAKQLLGKFTNYTPTGSNAFKKRGVYIKRGKGTPRRGDVIYFWSTAKGRIGHVGIVVRVSGSKVYTIEGNTTGASTLVTNGGGVRAKSYSLTSTYIDGYGRVDYSVVTDDSLSQPAGAAPESTILPSQSVLEAQTDNPLGDCRLADSSLREGAFGNRVLCNGCEGEDVKALQLALIALGFSCGSWGADGEFGDCTEMAVRAFQAAHNLEVDGEYGPETRAALEAAVDAVDASADPEAARYVQIEKGKKCYIREGAGTEFKALGVAHSLDKLQYAGETAENGWHRVKYGNGLAWVSGKYGKLVA